MKYLIILGDGMADKDIPELGGKTPLEYADTPTMDKYSKMSEIGMVHTIPDGMAPGSDTANLSVLGYNPRDYYTGRSPLEALSIGVDMKTTDVALRCNIVTVSTDELPYEEKTIIDHSSSEISTEDAAVLLEAVRKELENDIYKFYVGKSYRHLTIWDKGEVVDLTPPHDVLGQKGAMISAVDLLKGIAVGAGMKVIEVEGANGGLDTNYEGKADAAVDVLLNGGCDFAYIHLEAPDEMGHQGSYERKVKAIENLDKRIIKRVVEKMEAAGEDFRMLVLPDHPTPVAIRTNVSDPVPYMLYDSTDKKNNTWSYNEKDGEASGNYIAEGHTIINRLFEK